MMEVTVKHSKMKCIPTANALTVIGNFQKKIARNYDIKVCIKLTHSIKTDKSKLILGLLL